MKEKVNQKYLLKGLTALANAGYKGDWFYGHYGAAVLAGEFLAVECNLNEDVVLLIRNQIDKTILSQPSLFKDLINGAADKNWKEKIVDRLKLNLERLRTSGHGVIFGTLSLKASYLGLEKLTTNIVDGIVKLLELTTTDRFDRYFGIPSYESVKVGKDDNLPFYKDELDMIRLSFKEAKVFYPDETIGGKPYFFTGCKIHGITHAHALCVLGELGFKELMEKGYENQRLQLKLNRHKPPNAVPFKADKLYFPCNLDYWQRNLNDTHYIKLPYSGLSLLSKLPKTESESYMETLAALLS